METTFGFKPSIKDKDLYIIYLAGYNVNISGWKVARQACIEKVALLVCENPEKHSGEILDWAMEKLDD